MSPFDLESTIDTLVPQAYEARIAIDGHYPHTDMSHSNQCQLLTFDMMEALHNRGIPARREYHEDDDGRLKVWHYLLAHEDIGAEPTEKDIVTDMNPWQWTDNKSLSGHLFGPRYEVMNRLADAGAPDYFIALRGIQTITKLHVPTR